MKKPKKHFMKLQEAEEAVRDKSAWMSLDELKEICRCIAYDEIAD